MTTTRTTTNAAAKRGAALVLAALLVAPSVHAAPRPRTDMTDASAAAMADAARARFNEGLRLYARRKYSQALAAFLQAYALTKHPPVLLNLGQSALRAGQPLEAVRYFLQFLRDAQNLTPAQKTKAEKGIAEAREKLAAIEVNAPEGAEIAVDGEVVGRAPLAAPVDVLPGRHEVKMTLSDATKTETVKIAEGVTATVKLVAPGPTPSSRSRSVVENETGPEPVVVEEPSPHEAPTAEAPGLFSPPDSPAPVYVGGAVGLVALSAAIVLGGIRLNADRNKTTATDALGRAGKDPTACGGPPDPTIANVCGSLSRAQRTLDQTSGAHIGALAVGIGATAFALGWYLFAPKAGDAPDKEKGDKADKTGWLGPARVAPSVARDAAGVRVEVEF